MEEQKLLLDETHSVEVSKDNLGSLTSFVDRCHQGRSSSRLYYLLICLLFANVVLFVSTSTVVTLSIRSRDHSGESYCKNITTKQI
jgi:hypothetical protein